MVVAHQEVTGLLKSDLQRNEQYLHSQSAKLSKLESANSTLESANARRKSANSDLSHQAEAAPALESAIASLDAQLDYARNALKKSNSGVDQASGLLDKQRARINYLESDLRESSNRHTELEKALKVSHTEKKGLEDAAKVETAKAANDAKTIQTQLATLSELKQRAKSLTKAKENGANDLAECRSKLKECIERMDRCQEELDAASADRDKAQELNSSTKRRAGADTRPDPPGEEHNQQAA